jgi:GxxExxY protein
VTSLTELIIQCIITVHKTLGPGFMESVYQRALVVELRSAQLNVDVEKEVVIFYRGQEVGRHKLDMVVENSIIVELKTVEDFHKAHYAQVRSYLKATGLTTALLVNFSKEKSDFRRIDAPNKLDKSLSLSPTSPSLP